MVNARQGPVSRELRKNEPKWPRYNPAARYKPFCINANDGNYLVFDTIKRKAMPHPDVEHGMHRFGYRIVTKGLTYMVAEEFANTLNRLGPRLPKLHKLKKRAMA